MSKQRKRRSHCPISTALDLFGDKWSLLVVRDLMFKAKTSYMEFLESEEDIATNILADRLRTLEDAGVVRRIKDAQDRRKHRYMLTEKGIDLLPVLVELVLWSAKYDPETAADRAFVARAQVDKEGLLRDLRERLSQ